MAKTENTKLNHWICELASDMLDTMEENLQEYMDDLKRADNKKDKQDSMDEYDNELMNQHFKIHEVLEQMTAPVSIESEGMDEDEPLLQITPNQLKSKTLIIIARFLRWIDHNDGAQKKAKESFDLYPSQEAKYIITLAMEDIPVQTKSFTSSKKKSELEDLRKKEIIDLYLETVKMDPDSNIGKLSAIRLINHYKHKFQYSDAF